MARILAADDDLEALDLLKMTLELGGHQVTVAHDGRRALELGQAEAFDLYVLDVSMPYLDGYHVAEALSEKFPERPIILLTSRDFEKDQMAIQGSGADVHITKPFESDELLQAVNDLLIQKPS